MYRSRLMKSSKIVPWAVLGLAALPLVGCKSKSEQPEVKQTAKAVKAAKKAEPKLDLGLVYAASAHVRAVDLGQKQVVARMDLQRAVRTLVFSPDGNYCFVAASDGVRQFDARKHQLKTKLTNFPARNLEISPDGKVLWVLEHEVRQEEGKKPVPLPYRLLSFEIATGQKLSEQVVGDRILYAHHAQGEQAHHVVVTEAGEVMLAAAARPLAEAVGIDPSAGRGLDQPFRVRKEVVVQDDKAFLQVESKPSWILEVDLKTGQTRAMPLGRMVRLRGLARQPGSEKLYVNTSQEVFELDLVSGRVMGEHPLPEPHLGISFDESGKVAYLAQTLDGKGGAVSVFEVEGFKRVAKVHLPDVTPHAIAVRPAP